MKEMISKVKGLIYWVLIIFVVTTILGLLGVNTFFNYLSSQYYQEKRDKLNSSQKEEDKDLDRELKRKQIEKLGFNPADKGKILTAETADEAMNIEDLEYRGQTGQLILSKEIREYFLAILEDLKDLERNGTVDIEKDKKADVKDKNYFKRRNAVLYGAAGTGKTCFINELFWKLKENFVSDTSSISSDNPNASILQQQINNGTPPIFKIDGVVLQTGGALTGQLESYKKLLAIIKYLKQEYFGDEFSQEPYIVFVEEADQGANVANKEKGKLLEDWKNFLSTAEDKAGLRANAQDPNSCIIIATNNYENLDPALFRKGRLGTKLNFNWTPEILKEYGEKKFGISWPKNKEWDFGDSREYENLYSLSSRFGYMMAINEFVPHARMIINSYHQIVKNKDKKKEVEENLVKRRTGKKIKDENGNEVDEEICNWLLHYLYTFHQFNFKQNLRAFDSAEKIQAFDYGRDILLRNKLSAIRNGVATQLKSVADKLEEVKNEVNAQEMKGLMSRTDEVKNDLLVVESAVRVAFDQVSALGNLSNLRTNLQDLQSKVDGLQTKLDNLSLGGSSGSSSSTASAIDQITKEAIKKIKQKLNEL